MKKIKIVIPMLLSLGVLGFSGCGSSEGTITIWVASSITELTKKQAEEFKAANGMPYNIKVEAVGEGSAASNMITDVESGADLYGFAQDQFARLLSAGALAAIPSNSKDDHIGSGMAYEIYNRNDEISRSAMKHTSEDGKEAYFAYPMTSDNGYFMYYDKQVFPDEDGETNSNLSSLDKIFEVLKSNDRRFATEINWWYQAGIFFSRPVTTDASGNKTYGDPLCQSNWTIEPDGTFSATDENFNSDNGKIAAEAIKQIVYTNKDYRVDSCKAETFGATQNQPAIVITGMWEYNTALEKLGADRLGTTKLPEFTVGTNTYQMGSFAGCKLMGVKPHTDATKASWCAKLASHLTGKDCSLDRFKQESWGPSNLEAQKDSDVAANIGLNTLNKQNVYATIQGSYPSQWWDYGKDMVSSIKQDGNINAALSTYEGKVNGLLSK